MHEMAAANMNRKTWEGEQLAHLIQQAKPITVDLTLWAMSPVIT